MKLITTEIAITAGDAIKGVHMHASLTDFGEGPVVVLSDQEGKAIPITAAAWPSIQTAVTELLLEAGEAEEPGPDESGDSVMRNEVLAKMASELLEWPRGLSIKMPPLPPIASWREDSPNLALVIELADFTYITKAEWLAARKELLEGGK